MSVKLFARNSGAGNGCADFMGAWKNAFFAAGKPMPIKFPRFRGGGGVFWFFFYFCGGRGGGVPIFILMGARIFLISKW